MSASDVRQLIADHAPAFEAYFALLTEANAVCNLTAVTERNAVFTKHFADSLLGLEFLPEKGTLLDVGSGAGFPAVPLCMVRPALVPTLVDSVNKKVAFLQRLCAHMGIAALCLHARAEDLKGKIPPQDAVVARAVAPLATLAEYTLPYVKVGGVLVAYKADGCAEEVAAARHAVGLLGGGTPRIEYRRLDGETTRAFVLIEKRRPTPPLYPRGGNKPRTNPL
ncbi:MAG: 16S rRNA (guanine(527)-N(7))-methyltransferase RsmG [Clostridiales bacterium]|nr:16S rRNA (guanine(527)-N(7))-methyltransferase RsmG [Clostridiales bacterium]